MNTNETNKVYSPLWHQIFAIVRAGGDYYAIATEIEQLLSPVAVREVTDEEILNAFKQYSRMHFDWEWVEKYGAINHDAFIKAVRDLLTK